MRLFSLSVFEREHRRLEAQLRKFATKRGRHIVDDDTANGWTRESARALFATNMTARIEFARASSEVFRSITRRRGNSSFYFVTLTPKMFAVPLSEARAFDVETIKAWAGEMLEGMDYIGIVEAAYYSNFNVDPRQRTGTICWHVHAIVWNVDEERMSRGDASINANFPPMLPGRRTAVTRKLRAGSAESRVFYMLKAGLQEYRIWDHKEEVADPTTGELYRGSTGVFDQGKRELRPGDAVKTMKAMGDRTIPMLTFAGGEGVPIWKRAKALAGVRIAIKNSTFQMRMDFRFARNAAERAAVKRRYAILKPRR